MQLSHLRKLCCQDQAPGGGGTKVSTLWPRNFKLTLSLLSRYEEVKRTLEDSFASELLYAPVLQEHLLQYLVSFTVVVLRRLR